MWGKNDKKWSWNDKEMDGQSCPSNVSLQKIIEIHPFFGQTKTHNDLDEI